MGYFSDMVKEITEMEDVSRNFLVFSSRFNGGGAIIKPELAAGQWGEVKMAIKAQEMGREIFKIPGYRFAFAAQRPIFRSADKTFQIEITGPDMLALKNIANDLVKEISGVPGVHSVRPEYKFGNPELRFTPRRELAARLNMGMAETGDIIESLNAGKYLGEFNDRGEPIDFVLVQKKGPGQLNLHDYQALPLWTDAGMMTHLGNLADIRVDSGPARIDHIEKERSTNLRVQVRKDVPMQSIIDKVEEIGLQPKRQTLDEEYGLRTGGSADELASTQKSLMNSFVYAIGFIYLLLVALFASFLRPIIVMLTVALAVSGSFLGIAGNNVMQRFFIQDILEDMGVSNAQAMAEGWNWITFDILTQLGIVILAGIVVNNAILIVHQMLNNIKDGMEEREALLKSCETRLRPIMMTVISSVCGMMPLAFGEGSGTELYRGMGTALIGGLSVSAVFTLFLVPILISLLIDLGFHTRKEDLVKASLQAPGSQDHPPSSQPAQ
jgi:HAE1 family hydrophobic/amphiphilic exporter-1